MPLIRLTYERDIAAEGAEPIMVSDARAQVLVSKRRAVIVEPEESPTGEADEPKKTRKRASKK